MKSTSLEKSSRTVMGRVKVSYPRLRRVLVPLDFSGQSRQALRYAVPIAQKFGAHILLLHVLTKPAKPSKNAARPLADLAEQRRAALKRLISTGSQLIPSELHIDNIVLTGVPAEQILEVAQRRDIDMIVLATKGTSGLKRVLLGSTAESVMRQAPCPVLAVRRT